MCPLAKCLLLLTAAYAASSQNVGKEVTFHLYTRTNPTVSQVLVADPNVIMTSTFGATVRTIITIHSEGDSFVDFNSNVVQAHLQAENVNVLTVDWRHLAKTYTGGLATINDCANAVSEFVNILRSFFSYQPSQIRIVGYGLGAYVAGVAARQINGDISHIVALDPSFHGWTHHPDRLGPDAASLVEVIHTSAGVRGYDRPLGHIDFYANGGVQQPACGSDALCSQRYSYIYYAESITAAASTDAAKFVGTACDNYQDAMKLTCSGDRNVVFGGTGTKPVTSGIYYFRTRSSAPFAQN
ncbi:hypothetical protein ACJJTC_010220 [Scirpophaga incertulas]